MTPLFAGVIDMAIERGVAGGVSAGLAVAGVLGVIALLGWLVGGGAKADPKSGAVVLGYSAAFRGVAVLSGVVLPCIFVFAALFGDLVVAGVDPNPARTVGLLGVAGFFILCGVPLLLEGFRRRVVLSETGVAGRGWLRAVAEVEWEDITDVRFNKVLGNLVVLGGPRKVVVPANLVGGELVLKAFRKNLAKPVYGGALKAFRKAASDGTGL